MVTLLQLGLRYVGTAMQGNQGWGGLDGSCQGSPTILGQLLCVGPSCHSTGTLYPWPNMPEREKARCSLQSPSRHPAPSETAGCKPRSWLSRDGSIVHRARCPAPCLFPTGVGSCRAVQIWHRMQSIGGVRSDSPQLTCPSRSSAPALLLKAEVNPCLSRTWVGTPESCASSGQQ